HDAFVARIDERELRIEAGASHRRRSMKVKPAPVVIMPRAVPGLNVPGMMKPRQAGLISVTESPVVRPGGRWGNTSNSGVSPSPSAATVSETSKKKLRVGLLE